MKKILFILGAFFVFGNVLGQDEFPEIFPRDENNKIVFTEVVQVDSTLNQSQLFGNAKLFFANTFKSANDVIQLEDKENGRIVGKGLSKISGTRLYYTIQIEIKDGRYKYTIYDLYYHNYPDKLLPNPSPYNLEDAYSKNRYYNKKGLPKFEKKEGKEEIEKDVNNTIKLIKESMQKSSVSSGSDW